METGAADATFRETFVAAVGVIFDEYDVTEPNDSYELFVLIVQALKVCVNIHSHPPTNSLLNIYCLLL